MAGTPSKDTARGKVKKVFEQLAQIAGGQKMASEILIKFQQELVLIEEQVKRAGKTETIFGKYWKKKKLTTKPEGPVSKVVKKYLEKPSDPFERHAFVYDGTPNKALQDTYGQALKEFEKCKGLKSADVLIAMYYTADKAMKANLEVLGITLIAGVLDNLSKPNGFVKGGDGDEKDKTNKHLGLLAETNMRQAAKTANTKLRELLEDVGWLQQEQADKRNYLTDQTIKKIQNKLKKEPKTDRAKAIALQRKRNIIDQQLENAYPDIEVLPENLKPRDEDTGKYKKREMATEEQVQEFLVKATAKIHIKVLTGLVNDEERFKEALKDKILLNNEKVTMRAILNKLADIVYEGNSIPEVVKKLDDKCDNLDSILDLVQAKLEYSHAKDEPRKRLNTELQNWVAIISAVEACWLEVEVNYDAGNTYEQVLDNLVKLIKDINIKKVSEDGAKLEKQTIAQIEKLDVEDTNAFPGLTDEYKKRLKSLNIGFEEQNEYKSEFRKIITFLKDPNEETLKTTKVTIVEKTKDIQITQANWTASAAFDNFVKDKGAGLNDLLVEKEKTIHLPPCDGNKSDDRLGLSDGKNAYKQLKENEIFEWFDSPTLEEIDNATRNLDANDYLGKNDDLLTTLKKGNDKKYVLGINGDKYVDAWEAKFAAYMTKQKINKNHIVKKQDVDPSGIKEIQLKNGMAVLVIQGDEGLTKEQFSDYENYVTLNTDHDFTKALKKWSGRRCGKLLIKTRVAKLQEIPEQHNNNQQQEQPEEEEEGGNENEKKNNNQQTEPPKEGKGGGNENEPKNTNQQNEEPKQKNENENKDEEDDNNKTQQNGTPGAENKQNQTKGGGNGSDNPKKPPTGGNGDNNNNMNTNTNETK